MIKSMFPFKPFQAITKKTHPASVFKTLGANPVGNYPTYSFKIAFGGSLPGIFRASTLARVTSQKSDFAKAANTKGSLLGVNNAFICCKESRIESPTSFYGCFYLGPFDESFSQTLAHSIRRTLLSEFTGLAISAVEIDGVLHNYSSLPGVNETVTDLLSNLQNIVLKKNNVANSNLPVNDIAYLRVRGPGIVKASDILLSTGIECVDPEQYIATLAEDGSLNITIYINEGKNAIKMNNQNLPGNFSKKENEIMDGLNLSNNHNTIFLDSVFMPVTKVNAFVETNFKATDDEQDKNSLLDLNETGPFGATLGVQKTNFKARWGSRNKSLNNPNIKGQNSTLVLASLKSPNGSAISSSSGSVAVLKQPTRQCHIVLEIWTNGSLHPRQALKNCLQFLATTYITLDNVKMLGAMYKSDLTYAKILKQLEPN